MFKRFNSFHVFSNWTVGFTFVIKFDSSGLAFQEQLIIIIIRNENLCWRGWETKRMACTWMF